MKKPTILRSVLLALFGVLAINLDLPFADVGLQSKTNWLTVIPALAILAALVGLVIRKELKAAESGTRKAKAELATVHASARLDDLPKRIALKRRPISPVPYGGTPGVCQNGQI